MQPNPMGPAFQRLAEYQQRVAAIQRQAEQTQADIKNLRAHAQSADGKVGVVLAPGGRIERLTLTPSAMQLDHQQLADAITRTIQQAHQDAARRTEEALRPLVGDSDAMDFLRDQIGAAVADDPATPEQPPSPPPGPGRSSTHAYDFGHEDDWR